jgi:predicted TPR repeat methyltransferase
MKSSLLSLAIKAHQQGDFSTAESAYLELIKSDPNNADTLHLLSILYGQNLDSAKGLEYVERAIALQPKVPTFYNSLGNCHRRAGNFELAKQAYLQCLALDSSSATAHNNLGNVYFQLSEFDQAIHHYHEAIKINPEFADSHFNLAMLFIKKEDFPLSESHLESTLKVDSRHFEAHRQLGRLLYQRGDFERAIVHLSESAQTDFRHPDTYVNWGASLTSLDRHQEAIEIFQKALAIDSYHYEANFNLGATYLTLHLPKQALEHFLKLLDKHPSPELLYNVGVIYMYLDHHGEAIAYLKEVLKLEPQNLAARLNLGVTYIKTENYQDAITQYQEALKLDPENLEIQYTLAALMQGEAPNSAPSEYVERLFDQYAPYFDRHLTQVLHYETPKQLFEATKAFVESRQDLFIVDLGCGTGLCGEAFKPLAKKLIGIDLSSEMLKQAAEKKVYDQLIESDIDDGLTQFSDVDLILAGDVFTYLGDLDKTFGLAFNSLITNGLFSFTIENCSPPTTDFHLQQSARYCHHPAYIQRLAKHHGFTLLQEKEITLRLQKNHPLLGTLFVLQHP